MPSKRRRTVAEEEEVSRLDRRSLTLSPEQRFSQLEKGKGRALPDREPSSKDLDG